MTVKCTSTEPHQPSNMAGWLRLAAAASMAGVAPDTLAGWIERGAIPVSMRQQGERLRFVNAPQFHFWNGTPNALYTAEDLARSFRDYPPENCSNSSANLF